jgi:peptide subunit release factor 1 (eRF1)
MEVEEMPNPVPEADWKRFRKLREAALEEFCRRVLEETGRFRQTDGRSHHARYLALYRWLHDRDRELEQAFADPRRSQMVIQLATIARLGFVSEEDLAGFSSSTRKGVTGILEISDRVGRT